MSNPCPKAVRGARASFRAQTKRGYKTRFPSDLDLLFEHLFQLVEIHGSGKVPGNKVQKPVAGVAAQGSANEAERNPCQKSHEGFGQTAAVQCRRRPLSPHAGHAFIQRLLNRKRIDDKVKRHRALCRDFDERPPGALGRASARRLSPGTPTAFSTTRDRIGYP